MPVDYAEALRELEEQEGRLLTELGEVRAAKPFYVRKLASQRDHSVMASFLPTRGRFVGMGATKAIPLLLGSSALAMTSREIMEGLKAEGWTTNATDALATVSATLSNLRGDQLIKIGEGWTLRNSSAVFLEPFTVSDPAPNSLAATGLYPDPPNA